MAFEEKEAELGLLLGRQFERDVEAVLAAEAPEDAERGRRMEELTTRRGRT